MEVNDPRVSEWQSDPRYGDALQLVAFVSDRFSMCVDVALIVLVSSVELGVMFLPTIGQYFTKQYCHTSILFPCGLQ